MIYFIQSKEFGAIKIGYTSGSVSKRIEDLQVGNPDQLLLVGTIPGGFADEKKVHYRFKDSRIRGEWFKDTHVLRNFIKDNEKGQAVPQLIDIGDHFDLRIALEIVESQYVNTAFEQSGSDVSEAAKMLHISYAEMFNKIRKYGIV